MKKKALIMIVLLFSVLGLAAQSAVIAAPKAGDVLLFGNNKTIQWSFNGKAVIRLNLLDQAGAKLGTIQSGLPLSAGAFTWEVGQLEGGGSAPLGKGFKIVMRIDGSTTVLAESAPFEIAGTPMTPAPSPATIKVTSPKSGDEWCPGSTYSITWTKTGVMPATVDIRLRSAGSANSAPDALVIANNAANSGSFSWTIPGSLPTGDYFVLVNTANPASIPICPLFKIVNCLTQPVPPVIPPGNPPPGNMVVLNRNQRVDPALITPSLRVGQPQAGAVLKPGDTVPIAWTLTGGGYNQVKIMMYPAGQPHLARAGQVRWIAQNAPNSGVFSWKLNASERTGKHVIRVQTPDDKIFGDSGAFAISAVQNLTLTQVRAPDSKTLLADHAAIDIEELVHGMFDKGDVKGVELTVRATSSSGFVLTPLLGHPQYGSLYARCVVEVPRTAKDGSFTAVKVHDAVYSLKGAPPFKLSAHPTKIGWANASFRVYFDPDLQGKAAGQKVAIKQKSGVLEGGKLCIAEYFPKLTITLHLATQSGEAVAQKSIYILYDLAGGPMDFMVLPGEVEVCSKRGKQNW
ncbi:MAG: GPI anchored serine-threonine rich family protein [Acidobacteria bacterium]|jgi:hypothetical protein|nr:GPI anchored serine-threonine rich family protein [Acidobacteriota bacterium]